MLLAVSRARETVLEAGLSYKEGWENRLTAILATVLEQHWGFATAIFERVGLPAGEAYEAYTEEWVTSDRRVDMQLLAKDVHGAVIAQIWSEHKRIGGAFSTNQREDYLAALQREPGEGRLITVVGDVRAEEYAGRDGDEDLQDRDSDSENDAARGREEGELAKRPGQPSPEEARWWGLTWQLIAEIAEGAGQAWGGPNWVEEALARGAPAEQRALYELLWYLDQEGYAVVSPLQPEHVQSLKYTADTSDVVFALLSRAADNMAPLVPDGTPELDGDFRGYAQDFETPANTWPERLEGAIELLIWDDDGWVDEPANEPSVAVGVSLEPEWYRPLPKEVRMGSSPPRRRLRLHRVRGMGLLLCHHSTDRGR